MDRAWSGGTRRPPSPRDSVRHPCASHATLQGRSRPVKPAGSNLSNEHATGVTATRRCWSKPGANAVSQDWVFPIPAREPVPLPALPEGWSKTSRRRHLRFQAHREQDPGIPMPEMGPKDQPRKLKSELFSLICLIQMLDGKNASRIWHPHELLWSCAQCPSGAYEESPGWSAARNPGFRAHERCAPCKVRTWEHHRVPGILSYQRGCS